MDGVFGVIECYDETVIWGTDEVERDGGSAAMADRERSALLATPGSDFLMTPGRPVPGARSPWSSTKPSGTVRLKLSTALRETVRCGH